MCPIHTVSPGAWSDPHAPRDGGSEYRVCRRDPIGDLQGNGNAPPRHRSAGDAGRLLPPTANWVEQTRTRTLQVRIPVQHSAVRSASWVSHQAVADRSLDQLLPGDLRV